LFSIPAAWSYAISMALTVSNNVFKVMSGIAKQKLEDHFNPQKNVEFEIYKFRQAKPNSEETMDGYCRRMRHLAEYCEFQDNDREIKSQIPLSNRTLIRHVELWK
jgi:hypothetical protein